MAIGESWVNRTPRSPMTRLRLVLRSPLEPEREVLDVVSHEQGAE